MATSYEYWGYKFTEPDLEDLWSEISYKSGFEDIYAEFKVLIKDGEWIDDTDFSNKWEEADFYGDYGERLRINSDELWEKTRDMVADRVGDLPDGNYLISATVDFDIKVDNLYIGIAKQNMDDIYEDDEDVTITNINVYNINIEEV